MRRNSGTPFRPLRDGMTAVAILVLGTLIAAKIDGLNEQRISGRFHAVDGDTVARGAERFRLIGIDAPELKQICERGGNAWPCGAEAKTYANGLLQSDRVECVGSKRDRYKRRLVRCSIGDKDIAAQIVAAGYAVTTEYFLFSQEQTFAQEKRAGIWSGTFDQPAEWRRDHKAAEMDVPFAGLLTLVRHVLGW